MLVGRHVCKICMVDKQEQLQIIERKATWKVCMQDMHDG